MPQSCLFSSQLSVPTSAKKHLYKAPTEAHHPRSCNSNSGVVRVHVYCRNLIQHLPVNRLPHMPSLLYSSPCGVGAYGSGDAEGGLIAQQRSRCVREDAGCAHELREGFEADRVRSVMNESIEQLVNLFVVDNT